MLDEHTVEIDATIDVPAEKVNEEYCLCSYMGRVADDSGDAGLCRNTDIVVDDSL